MTAKSVDVFFYGLFMDPDALRKKGINPRVPRVARVADMALRVRDRATLVRKLGSTVYGVVMTLTEEELGRLYSESSVAAYRPETVLAQFENGSAAQALCYNLPPTSAGGDANPEYSEKLRAVASQLGLPDDYVRAIG